jgi:hypothetical protein
VLALALAAPVFPLGNVALGLALLYGVVAAGWLVAFWRETRWGTAFVAGALLAPVGLLALMPLLVLPVRAGFRRAAIVLAAVAAAAIAAGVRAAQLPLGQGPPPPFDLDQTESARTALGALVEAAPPGLALGGVALAAVAVAIPHARTPWRIAGLGAGALATTLLLVPAAPALPLVAAVWLTCAVLSLKSEH